MLFKRTPARICPANPCWRPRSSHHPAAIIPATIAATRKNRSTLQRASRRYSP